ncbi:MAG: lamin tail domain-containing protein [Bacteroidales bacterium]|nr:lamin tail domain-containing protein [Bacteroidales bacterium]
MKQAAVLLMCFCIAWSVASQPSEVRISEILFNPIDDGADYLELYNSGVRPVSLGDIRVARWRGNEIDRLYSLETPYILAPKQYVVITTNAADIQSRYKVQYPNRVVEVPALPAYNNASGTVLLCTVDTVLIDRLDYTENMHSPLLRSKEGVALERRSFDRPTQETSNWYSAASTVGYGTPTYRNSQSQEVLFLEDAFSVSADLISPDGDGYQDLLDLTWQLSRSDLYANITLFDAQGRVARHLLRNGSLGTEGVLTWDGLSDDGIRCRRGNYVLWVETYDVSGRQQTLKRTITLIIK